MSMDVAVRETRDMSGFEMKPKNLDEAMRFCEIMAGSDLVPKDYRDKPGNIMVAIQLGAELGMTPMRALRCIAVVNGRPTMWGDEMLAMVLASPHCEYISESDSTDKEGVCRVKRVGAPEHVSRFTLQDAQKAGLLVKGGTWQTYTGRMLKLRARGFALRDVFADVLAGIITTEEALDIPTDKPDRPAEQVTAVVEKPTLKDKLKAQIETVKQDGASVTTRTPQVAQQASDAAPPFNPEVCPPADPTPQLTAGNVCRQLMLCEEVTEWSTLRNAWEQEKYLHSEADRKQVIAAFDQAKKRMGKK